MVYIILPLKESYMIPEFNKYGNLLDGIYKVTLKEIKKKFGSESLQRKKLFKHLNSLTKLLLKNKSIIIRFIVNGSFVTDVEFPNDIDCIIIFSKKFPHDLLLMKLKKCKAMHIFDYTEYIDAFEYNGMINLFRHTRDRRLKGILEVQL
jgi:hypothetical protein